MGCVFRHKWLSQHERTLKDNFVVLIYYYNDECRQLQLTEKNRMMQSYSKMLYFLFQVPLNDKCDLREVVKYLNGVRCSRCIGKA